MSEQRQVQLHLAIARPKGKGGWGWRIVSEDGSYTQGGAGVSGASGYRLWISGLCDGLGSTPSGSRVVAHVSDGMLKQLVTEWLPRWEDNGWRGREGSLKEVDALQRLSEALKGRELDFQLIDRKRKSHDKDAKMLAKRFADAVEAAESPEPKEKKEEDLGAVGDPEPGTQVIVWTDGGSRPGVGIGAWAFVMVHVASGATLERSAAATDTTNNRMEWMAVLEALSAIQRPGTVVEVRTDSRLVVQTANEWLSGWKRRGWKKANDEEPANLDLVRAYDTLSSSLRIRMRWVRGHKGICGNERADTLATESMERLSLGDSQPYEERLAKPPFPILVG